jgi:hypothetical protein
MGNWQDDDQKASRTPSPYCRSRTLHLVRISQASSARSHMSERRLGQVEAAELVGCSRDTIARARRAGRFPRARLERGRWTVPVEDLVGAGLLDVDRQDSPTVHDSLDPPSLCAGSIELARAEARIAGLEEIVARQDDELQFLRHTVQALAKRGSD